MKKKPLEMIPYMEGMKKPLHEGYCNFCWGKLTYIRSLKKPTGEYAIYHCKMCNTKWSVRITTYDTRKSTL